MKKTKLVRSAFTVGSFTLVSRALGMVRDILTAGLFGTSLSFSAFVVAFRIPNLFRSLFGEGALSAAFVPVFMSTKEKEGSERAWDLANKVITLVGLVLLLISIIGIFIITVLLPLFHMDAKTTMVLSLLRIMLPYVLFICLSALSMGILNSFHQFAIPAATPTLLNITWILFVLFVCPRIGIAPEQQIYGLAWAVLIAGIVQLSVQYPALRYYGYRPGFIINFTDKQVIRVFTLMGPAALGSAVNRVNIVISSILAMWVGSWAPAVLYCAERLIYFPQGLLATAFSTVLLPALSGHFAKDNKEEAKETIVHSARILFFVMAPAAIGLLVLAKPIIQLLFEHGAFDATSTNRTAIALRFYSLGLLFFCLPKVFVPAFYAMQDTRTPVKIGIYSVILNFACNIVFILTLPRDIAYAGLAFSTVIAEACNGLVLGITLRHRLGKMNFSSFFLTTLRALMASVIMGVVIWYGYPWIQTLIAHWITAELIAHIIAIILGIGLGIGVYFLTALALRYPEMRDLIQTLQKRK